MKGLLHWEKFLETELILYRWLENLSMANCISGKERVFLVCSYFCDTGLINMTETWVSTDKHDTNLLFLPNLYI